jgi:hypothetical protein
MNNCTQYREKNTFLGSSAPEKCGKNGLNVAGG